MRKVLGINIILGVLLVLLVGLCEAACPRGCSCITSTTQEVSSVTCNHAGFTSIPRDIPPSTVKLTLTGNKIKTVTEEHFKELINLRTVELISNNIENIQAGAFHGLTNLKNINLFGNKLGKILKHTFTNLNDIDILDFESNNMTEIEEEAIFGSSIRHLNIDNNPTLNVISNSAFSGSRIAEISIKQANLSSSSLLSLRPLQSSLSYLAITENQQQLDIHEDLFKGFKLKELILERNGIRSSYFLQYVETSSLSLSGNPIGPIPFILYPLTNNLVNLNLSSTNLDILYQDLFADLLKLKTLDMSYNDIRILPREMKKFIKQLDLLRLEGNPLHCNCRMLWLQNYTRENPLKILGAGCTFPELNAIQNLEVTKFKCIQPYNISAPKYVNIALHAEMSLACSASGDPAPKIIWNLISGGSMQVDSAEKDAPGSNKGYVIVRNMTEVMFGIYECVAKNLAGESRVKVNVTAAKYFITSTPALSVSNTSTAKIGFNSSRKSLDSSKSKTNPEFENDIEASSALLSNHTNETSENNFINKSTEIKTTLSVPSFQTNTSGALPQAGTTTTIKPNPRMKTSTIKSKVYTQKYQRNKTASKRKSKISPTLHNSSANITFCNFLFVLLLSILF